MIKKVHHAVITVSDMEEALHFYRDILGCKVTMDFEISGGEWGEAFGVKEFRARLVYLDEGIELAYYYQPGNGRPLKANPWDPGYHFLVLEVKDLEEIYSRLTSKGVEFFLPPHTPEGEVPSVGKTKVAHLKGPDGVRISMVQLPGE